MEDITEIIAKIDKKSWKRFFNFKIHHDQMDSFIGEFFAQISITDKSKICLEVFEKINNDSWAIFAGLFETIESSTEYLDSNNMFEQTYCDLFIKQLLKDRALNPK